MAQGAQGLAIGTPKGIGTGKLLLSTKGRGHLVGKTKRNMVVGYALGGVLFVGGTGLGLFGPKAEAHDSGCTAALANVATASCDDRMYDAAGKDFVWRVTEAASYQLTLKQPNVANPVDGILEITDASGGEKVAYDDGGSSSTNAAISQVFQPGTYTINVRDFSKSTVEGGYGFHLNIEKVGPAPTAPELTQASLAASAPVAIVAKPAPVVAAHGAGAKGAAVPAKPAAGEPGRPVKP